MEEIRQLGLQLYGISNDRPSAHKALVEAESLDYELFSDPQYDFYRKAGIMNVDETNAHRGIVVYDGQGQVIFREVTDDPAAALLSYLGIES